MTLTLEVPPELEKQLETAARQRGTDLGAWVLEAARRALDPDTALDALIDALPDVRAAHSLPPLSEEQVSRAAFYDDDSASAEREQGA